MFTYSKHQKRKYQGVIILFSSVENIHSTCEESEILNKTFKHRKFHVEMDE